MASSIASLVKVMTPMNDSAIVQNDQKRKNKRRKKQKNENEDFIMRVGRIPIWSIQLNVCAYFYVNSIELITVQCCWW